MKKTLKILFKFLGVFLLLIFALLLIIPTFFKETIKEKVVDEVNKSINAVFSFDDFSLSLIRNFPNLNFRLEGVTVMGEDRFEGDTLAGFNSFGFVFDLSSLFGKDGYSVRSIVVDRPVANAIVLEDGTQNWDIVIPGDVGEVESVVDDSSAEPASGKGDKDLKVQLKEIAIKRASIKYTDIKSGMIATIGSLDLRLSGNLSESLTDLLLDIDIGGLYLNMKGEQYVNSANVTGEFDIAADLENQVFRLTRNSIRINNLALFFDGTVQMEESDIITNMKLSTGETNFKSLLSMVPVIYMNDFSDLRTDGSIKLDVSIDGRYSSVTSTFPEVGIGLQVNRGAVWYKGSPQMISNLNLQTDVNVKEGKILGTADLNIDEINMGDILSLMPSDTTDIIDTTAAGLQLVVVPENIDFEFRSVIGRLLFDPVDASDLKAMLTVRDGVMKIEETGLNTLGGIVSLTGLYDTRDIEIPILRTSLSVDGIAIKESFETFNTVQKLAPVAEGMDGKASVLFEFSSLLRKNMKPDLNSINGRGRFESEEIQLINSSMFNKFNDLLKLDDQFSNTFKDVEVEFRVEEGRVYFKPFPTTLGKMKLIVGGDHGLDQTINYLITSSIPATELPSSLNMLVTGLKTQATLFGMDYTPPEVFNVNVAIKGTVKDPKFVPSLGESAKSVKENIKESVTAIVEQKVEEVKETVSQELNRQAEEIMAEAEVQASRIKEEAARAAQKVRDEASVAAEKLTDEAESKGPLAKIAAKKAADVLVKEADKKAIKLENEANIKADKILDAARKKTEELKNKLS